MLSHLTEEESKIVREMREEGDLLDVHPNQLMPHSVLVSCGDCDASPHFLAYHESLCRMKGSLRIHPITNNGGALVFDPESPTRMGYSVSDFFLLSVSKSLDWKKLSAVTLRVHAPCGAARDNKLNPREQVNSLRTVHHLVQELRPGLNVVSFLDVLYANNRFRTYNVPKK